MSPEDKIKQLAEEAGFQLCGIASMAQAPTGLTNLTGWLAQGRHAGMAWMERQAEKRLDPTKILPSAKSLICVGLVYNTAHPYSTDVFPMNGRTQTRPAGTEGKGWISRYAWGDDYHSLMEQKLADFERMVKAELDDDAEYRSYSDTGPISEKEWAAASGIGWKGKHTNLISAEHGSWFFLGEILTSLELEPDAPARDLCGNCTRCIDACPTIAITAPYELDARRCLSYLSIEHKGPVPDEFASAFGANVYGCDICQDVCPWNGKRVLGHDPAFEPRPGLYLPDLAELAAMDETAFSERFKGSAMKRTKHAGLQRNVALATPPKD